MTKKKYPNSEEEGNTNNFQEPLAEYGTTASKQFVRIPGQVTMQELSHILDEAEIAYEKGEGISHEEVLRRMKEW